MTTILGATKDKTFLKDWIAKKGFKPEFGARPMRMVITENIEAPLSESTLDEKFKNGVNILVDLTKDKIVLTKRQ